VNRNHRHQPVLLRRQAAHMDSFYASSSFSQTYKMTVAVLLNKPGEK
jgi:hypothetical protein